MTAHLLDFVVPDPPCVDCRMSVACAQLQLACKAFRAYAKLERWADVPREPSRALFIAVFNPRRRDDATLRALRARQHAARAAHGTEPGRRSNPEARC